LANKIFYFYFQFLITLLIGDTKKNTTLAKICRLKAATQQAMLNCALGTAGTKIYGTRSRSVKSPAGF